MTATIISIGDELLVGQVVNTNASWLGDQLTRIGCRVLRVEAIGDERELIRREIEAAAQASDVVIVSGGLGPTHDDVTREAICDLLGCDLAVDREQLGRIERRFAERGIELNERSRRQALAPAACRTLPNDYGSAPGLAFTVGSARVYALPGVPSEMKGIFTDQILPEIGGAAGDIDQKTYLAYGITESALADVLVDTIPLLDHEVTLAYLPSAGGIRLPFYLAFPVVTIAAWYGGFWPGMVAIACYAALFFALAALQTWPATLPLTPGQIVEALLQSAAYCGFPRALNATAVARKVFAERGLLPVGEQPASSDGGS